MTVLCLRSLGPFSYFFGTMTQAKAQLDTFKSWAGKASDISYYLNSHHMDWHCWATSWQAKPTKVIIEITLQTFTEYENEMYA